MQQGPQSRRRMRHFLAILRFPADHPHHRGLFWAWPHVTMDGRHLNLWMLNGIEPRFERWGLRRAEAKRALLGVENGCYAAGRGTFSDQPKILIRGIYRPYRIKASTAPEAGSESGSRPRLSPCFQP